MDIHLWYRRALDYLDGNVTVGDTFLVKELFEGCDWNALPKGDRIRFGTFFSNEVKSGKIPCLLLINENQKGSNRYQKVEEGDHHGET